MSNVTARGIEVGQRVRFRAKEELGNARSTLRPGEVWEGVVASVMDAERIMVRIEQLNGMRADGVKEVCVDAVQWDDVEPTT